MESLHYLSEQAMSAPRLSASQVAPKVRAGWEWRRLVPGFGACGGTANYSRALVAPDGQFAYVTDRADGPTELDALPVLSISHQLVKLTVPFAEKDAAKSLGAVWVGHKKTWACAPERVAAFVQWIAGEPEEFDLLG